MLRNRDLDNREDGVLYVDEYVSSRTQDVYLHYPVLETPLVQRDLRRRATSNLKQPSYYGNKKKQYSPLLIQILVFSHFMHGMQRE